MTPQGSFIVITKALQKYARSGDGKALRAYIESPKFMDAYQTIPPYRRHTVHALWAQADAACKARRPVPTPHVAKRADWKDPVFMAKFRNGCVRGLDNDDLARLCRITPAAAKRARERFVDAQPMPYALAA